MATGNCSAPDLHGGVVLTNPNSTYGAGHTLLYACARGHELTAGNLTQLCLENGDWAGTAPRCKAEKDKNKDDDMTVSYVAIGIVLGSILVLIILAIDFSFHIKRRLRSKRYQKRRQVHEMGHAHNHKRPVPFFVTSQTHGYTNKGFGFSDEFGSYPTDSELQNGPPLSRLPPIVVSDNGGSSKKKKKKKQIFPECLNSSPVSDQEIKTVPKKSRKKFKKKKKTMEMPTNYELDQPHVDRYAYSGEHNNNDSLLSAYENHSFPSGTPQAGNPLAYHGTAAPPNGTLSGMPVLHRSGGGLPQQGHSDSGNSSKGYPHALDTLETYDHNLDVVYRENNMSVQQARSDTFPKSFPHNRQIEKTSLKLKTETGNEVHFKQVSGSRPLPPVPVVTQPHYQPPMPASIEIHGAPMAGIPV